MLEDVIAVRIMPLASWFLSAMMLLSFELLVIGFFCCEAGTEMLAYTLAPVW